MSPRGLVAGGAVVAALAVAAPAHAAASSVTPRADAAVRSDAPRAPDGRARTAAVARTRGSVRRAYLRFAPRVPQRRTLVRAKLVLYPVRGGAGIAARGVRTGRWSERRLTWRTAPRPGGIAARRGAVRRGKPVSLDVTRLVRGARGQVTIALTAQGRRRLAFATREAAKARRPRLVLVTAPAAPGTAPAPARTQPVSAAGPADTTPPAAPGDPVATAADSAVMLAWPVVADAAGYRVYRRAADGSWSRIATAADTSAEDRGLANGVAYAYRVTAVDAAGNESAPSPVAAATPSAGPADALHATAREPFVTAAGAPLKLLSLNVIPVWRSSPGKTWAASRFQQIADKGFDAVRFTLYWDDFEPSPGSFDATSLATLDLAVARAKAAGLRVVLDCIHLWGQGGFTDVPAWARAGDSVATVQANGGAFLKLLAARYRDEPAVVAYDLVNEFQRWPVDQDAVLRAYDHLIGEVRTADPRKIVMLEPMVGDSSIAGADFSNLTHRSNVVWSIHDYFAGGDDDGYGPGGGQQGTFTWDGTTGYPVPDPAALERHLRVTLDKLATVGLPLWIGEFGVGENAVNRDQLIRDKVALYDRYGLGRSWWEYSTTRPFSSVDASGAWKPWVDLLLA